MVTAKAIQVEAVYIASWGRDLPSSEIKCLGKLQLQTTIYEQYITISTSDLLRMVDHYFNSRCNNGIFGIGFEGMIFLNIIFFKKRYFYTNLHERPFHPLILT